MEDLVILLVVMAEMGQMVVLVVMGARLQVHQGVVMELFPVVVVVEQESEAPSQNEKVVTEPTEK
jgi:hypothetical protein